jgi:hypothetical protein
MFNNTSTRDHLHRQVGAITLSSARLFLSFVAAGCGLLSPHFAAVARPDAPLGASNHGF